MRISDRPDTHFGHLLYEAAAGTPPIKEAVEHPLIEECPSIQECLDRLGVAWRSVPCRMAPPR